MIRLPVLLLLALLISGCGKGPDKPGAATPGGGASTDVKVVAKALEEEPAEVTALLRTDKHLFVGTKKGLRVLTYDPATKKLETASDVPVTEPAVQKYAVNALRRDGIKVHVATTDGLATWDGKSWDSESMGPVLDVVNYAGSLWIARSRGLEKKSGKEWVEQKVLGLTVNPGSSSRTKSLALTPEGKPEPGVEQKYRLWVGSEFGIYSFNNAEKKWSPQLYGEYLNVQGDMVMPEKGNSELCGNDVNKLAVDPDTGRLLVCTQTGLAIFDGNDQWKIYQGDYETHTAETGLKSRVKKKGNTELPSPSVTAALLLGNSVWIGMSEGLARVDGDKVTLFDTNSELPSSAVHALAHDPANGVLFVGTERGVAALAPVGAAPASK